MCTLLSYACIFSDGLDCDVVDAQRPSSSEADAFASGFLGETLHSEL